MSTKSLPALEMQQIKTNGIVMEMLEVLDKSGEEISSEFVRIWQEEMDVLGFIYE